MRLRPCQYEVMSFAIGMSSRLRQAYVAAKFYDFMGPYNEGAPKLNDGRPLILRLGVVNQRPMSRAPLLGSCPP